MSTEGRLTSLLRTIEASDTIKKRRKNALSGLREKQGSPCPNCKKKRKLVFHKPDPDRIRRLAAEIQTGAPVLPSAYDAVLNLVRGRHELLPCSCVLLGQIRIPPPIWLQTPEEFREPNPSFQAFTVNKHNRGAYLACKGWVKLFVEGKQKPGAILCGPVGTGKSRLMWTVLSSIKMEFQKKNDRLYEKSKKAIESGSPNFDLRPPYLRFKGRLTTIARLSEELKRCVSVRQDIAQLRQELLSSDLLILDDSGAENPSEFIREELYLLVDERIQSRKPVMATCNFEPEALGTWLGDRISSRLQGACDIYTIDGPDMRITLKKQMEKDL